MKSLEENKYYIWLSSITEIDTITKIKLLAEYKNPIKLFYEFAKQPQKELEQIDKKILKMKQYGITVLTYFDKEYPKTLKYISDFPICLYCKGNTQILNNKNKLAIIGCRDYSLYGEKVATKFAYELAKNGIIIVSGCAKGIDSFSHKGCLMAKQSTIAVLGNGLDYIYPSENKILEEQILQNNGLLLSEYIIGTKPSKYTFPARNRIISAISDGVLVVEAKKKSGTLITVDFALEQGKNIYAVPGNINNLNAVGTNELIKQGAKVVTNINDIIEDFII